MPEACFVKMITDLRQHENIMLYGNLLVSSAPEDEEVSAFLKSEYQKEALAYPGTVPVFDTAAALWAAKIVYVTAQLILYRENKEVDILSLLPDHAQTITPSGMLSADLCLRFVPDMLLQLKMIDSEDILIAHLERQMQLWHYSGIKYELATDDLDFTVVMESPCLHQLYIDRIIEYRKLELATHLACRDSVLASLGDHTDKFWKELKTAVTLNE